MRWREKQTGQDSKKTSCFGDWLCQKKVSLGRQQGTGWRVKGELLGFWRVGERCKLRLQRERRLLRFAGVPHCGNAMGHSLALLRFGHKEGFLHLFIQFHAVSTPKWAHSPSKTALSPFMVSLPNPLSKKRDL